MQLPTTDKSQLGAKMSTCDKIFFLHIPKTAGSAFNDIFKPCVPEARYFEHMESRRELFETVKGQDAPFFLSEHFAFETARSLIERTDVFSISIVREPIPHLLSHLKWVKYVGSPQYPNHETTPDQIMDLARLLVDVSLGDVVALEELLDSPAGRLLFDNLQVRYLATVTADTVTNVDLERARGNARRMSFVFALEDIDRAVTRLRWHFPRIVALERYNQTPIDERVDFHDPQIWNFYRERTVYDRALYEDVRMWSLANHLSPA
ncbi:MAG: hypothetical protein ACREMD_02370 [Gemmatimonadota bacterium]